MISTHAAKTVISALCAVLLIAGGLFSPSAAESADLQAKERVVLQVSDDNPRTWNQALNVIENLQQAYGKQNVDIELVAFGFGLGILKLESVTGNRVQDALQKTEPASLPARSPCAAKSSLKRTCCPTSDMSPPA